MWVWWVLAVIFLIVMIERMCEDHRRRDFEQERREFWRKNPHLRDRVYGDGMMGD